MLLPFWNHTYAAFTGMHCAATIRHLVLRCYHRASTFMSQADVPLVIKTRTSFGIRFPLEAASTSVPLRAEQNMHERNFNILCKPQILLGLLMKLIGQSTDFAIPHKGSDTDFGSDSTDFSWKTSLWLPQVSAQVVRGTLRRGEKTLLKTTRARLMPATLFVVGSWKCICTIQFHTHLSIFPTFVCARGTSFGVTVRTNNVAGWWGMTVGCR
jgi:hypothetical protein